MPIDVSMYNQKQQDPFAPVQAAVGISNALTQNNMLRTQNDILQKGYQGDVAVGNAFQGAIDPNTGKVDVSKLNQSLSSDPNAAYRAAEALQRSGNLQGTLLQNQGSSTEQSKNRINDFYATVAAPLAASGQPMTKSDLVMRAGDMLSQGRLLPEDFKSLYSEIPSDPAELKKYATQRSLSTLSPGQQMSPTTIGITPQGVVTGTMGQFTTKALGEGESRKSGGEQPQGVKTSLGVGAPEAIQANQNAFLADQQGSSKIMASMRPLQNALTLAQSLSNKNFGPGSTEFNKVKSFLITAGVLPENAPDSSVLSAAETTSRQELKKYLTNYSSARGGSGTDLALSKAFESNPNLEMNKDATVNLIKSQIGRDRMDASMPMAYQTAHPGMDIDPTKSSGYLTHKSNFYQKYDPTAFQFDLMSPDEQDKYVKSLGPEPSKGEKPNAKRQKFIDSLRVAHQSNMLEQGGGSQ